MSNQLTIQQNNAFAGNKPFKFVLANASIGSLTTTRAPDGWKDNEMKLARHKTYHGVMKSVSTKELIFYKEGKDFLQRAYEAEGVNCVTSLTITRYNYNTMVYDNYHTGYIDFTTYVVNEVSVTVMVASDSFWKKVLTRDTLEVDLTKLVSVEGYNVRSFGYNSFTIPDTNVNNAANFTEISSGFLTSSNAGINHVIPCTVGVSNYNETQTQTLSTNIENRNYAFFKESEVNRILNVAGSFDVEFTLPGGAPYKCEFVLKTLDADNTVLLETSLGSTAQSAKKTITFDKNITVYAGQSVILEGKDLSSLTDKFEYSSLDFDVTETVVGTVETECRGFMVYEAFLRCLQLITDTGNPFYSDFFGRTDSALTTYSSDGELIGLIKGYYFRSRWTNEPMVVKLKDLFDSMFSIYALSLNHEYTAGSADPNKIRVENLAYAYSQTVVLDVSGDLRSEDIEKSVNPDLIYSKVEVGYNKFNYEQTGGLWEYNTKSVWSTVIRTIKNEFRKISKYRADYNGIKLQIDTTDLNEDAKGDNDNFLVTMKRDGATDFEALQDDNFTYVGGTFYADKSLNLDISPARNMRNMKDFIRGSLLKNLNTYLRWQTSEKPSALETQKSGENHIVDEDADVRVGPYEEGGVIITNFAEPLWHPETYKIEVPLTYDQITTVLANPRGLIQIADNKYGWIMNMQTKNWDGMTEFELLRANNDAITPYPIEGAIRFVKDGAQNIDQDDMQLEGVDEVTIDWGDGTIEDVPVTAFGHNVADGAIVVIYGAVTEFTMHASIKISHISAVHHATLTTLTVSDNNNEGADFDRSTALTTIKLDDNSLETIILTGCTGLTWLRLYNNDTFTENIDVSECTALGKYENYNCAQTAIDVSLNTALYYLDCRNNSLTSIDLSANPLLVTLSIRSNSSLTAIDLSNNPILAWMEARSCGLASLDIGNNPLLVYVHNDYNDYPVADINQALIDLDGFGELNGFFDVENNTPPSIPTGAGATAKANLIGKGWTIETD